MLALRNRRGSPFGLLNDDFDRVFSKIFEGMGAPKGIVVDGPAFPPLKVTENESDVVVEAEVPGLTMKDLDVNVLENTMTITGEKKEAKEEKGKTHWRETRIGSFSRGLRFPFPVDAVKASAELKAGILRITLPKDEAAKPKKIDVKISK